jgi:hypothetical protein
MKISILKSRHAITKKEKQPNTGAISMTAKDSLTSVQDYKDTNWFTLAQDPTNAISTNATKNLIKNPT